MFKRISKCMRICFFLLLGAVILTIGYIHGGLPQYSLRGSFEALLKNHMIEEELDLLYRRKAKSDYEVVGDWYNYAVASDDESVYCARFTGNSNPFYGWLPLAYKYENLRDTGGYRLVWLETTLRGKKIAYALGDLTDTRYYELPLFVLNENGRADRVKATLSATDDFGTLTVTAETRKTEDSGFVLWFHIDNHSFKPNADRVRPENDTPKSYYMSIRGNRYTLDDPSASIKLHSSSYSSYMQDIDNGLLTAQLTITLYANEEVLCTESFLLNPDVSAIKPY